MGKYDIGGVVATMVLNDDSFRATLERAGAKTRRVTSEMSESFLNVGKGLAIGLSPAIAGATTAIYKAHEAMKELSGMGDQAAKLGVTVDSLIGLQHAGNLSGVALETLSGGIVKMKKNLYEAAVAGGPVADALGRIGLSASQLLQKKPEVAFGAIADGLNGVANANERSALTMDIFGKSGADLIPLLYEGSAGLKEMQQDAEDLGLTVTPMGAAMAKVADDDIARLEAAGKGLWRQLAVELSPAFNQISTDSIQLIKDLGGMKEIAVNIGYGIQTVVAVAMRLGDAFMTVYNAVNLANDGVKLIVKAALYPFAYAVEKIVNGAILARNKLAKIKDSAASEWASVDLTSGLAASVKESVMDVTVGVYKTLKSARDTFVNQAADDVSGYMDKAANGIRSAAAAVIKKSTDMAQTNEPIMARAIAKVETMTRKVEDLGKAWDRVKGTMLSIADIAAAKGSSSNRTNAQRAQELRERAAEAEKAGRFGAADKLSAQAEKLESKVARRERDDGGKVIDRGAESLLRNQATGATSRVDALMREADRLAKSGGFATDPSRQRRFKDLTNEAGSIADRLRKKGFGSEALEKSLDIGRGGMSGAAKTLVEVKDGIESIRGYIATLAGNLGLA